MVTNENALRFSILIPSWNNLDFLKLCVRSIRQHSACEHQILIHVNDGSDGTLEWVREQGFGYTHSEENIGVCWALNGLRPLVMTDYIVFINDDMYVCPGWDVALAKEIRRIGHHYFFLSSTVLQPRTFKLFKHSIAVADYGTTVGAFREADLLAHYNDLQLTDWKGATAPPNVVHRDLWDLVGGYSVEFTPGMASDPDFSAKLWLAGVREFRGLAASRVYHFMSRSVNRIVKNRGSVQFLRKYGITIRAFREDLLRFGEPATDTTDVSRKLRADLWRSRLKRVMTMFNDIKTKRLWE